MAGKVTVHDAGDRLLHRGEVVGGRARPEASVKYALLPVLPAREHHLREDVTVIGCGLLGRRRRMGTRVDGTAWPLARRRGVLRG